MRIREYIDSIRLAAVSRSTSAVWSSLAALKPTIYCLGKTKGGAPKHPLYIKTGTPLEEYRP